MATLNFPSDPSTQNPVNTYSPDSTPLASDNGVTYVWDGEKWTANSGGGNLDDVYVNVNGDTMTGDLTVPNLISEGDVQTTSLNGGPLAGFRNQIINGDLRVWQRGDGPFNFAGGEFLADRWLKNGNGLVNKSSSAPEGFVASLEVVATTPPIIQKIELPSAGNCGPFKQGSKWTVSLWSDRDISGGTVDLVFFTSGGNADNVIWNQQTWAATSDATSNGFNRYSATFTALAPNASNTSLALYIDNHASVTTKYAAIQLEPGSVATPFEIRPISLELQLCQRYYWNTSPVSGTVTRIGCGVIKGTRNEADIMVPLPTSMRATPTLIQGNTSVYDGASTITVTNSILSSLTANTLRLDSTLAVTSTTGSAALLQGTDMAFDAEL